MSSLEVKLTGTICTETKRDYLKFWLHWQCPFLKDTELTRTIQTEVWKQNPFHP